MQSLHVPGECCPDARPLGKALAKGSEGKGTSATLSGPLLGFELCPFSPCRRKLRECFSLNNSSLLCNPSDYCLPDQEEPGVKLTSLLWTLEDARPRGRRAQAQLRPRSRTARLPPGRSLLGDLESLRTGAV